ncbi:hypothetical protein CapIbe_016840 [Capra ibex]
MQIRCHVTSGKVGAGLGPRPGVRWNKAVVKSSWGAERSVKLSAVESRFSYLRERERDGEAGGFPLRRNQRRSKEEESVRKLFVGSKEKLQEEAPRKTWQKRVGRSFTWMDQSLCLIRPIFGECSQARTQFLLARILDKDFTTRGNREARERVRRNYQRNHYEANVLLSP